MLCPNCMHTVDDSELFCSHCHAYLGDADGPEHAHFLFCEGCGARMAPDDRTCPKCGRPASSILSTSSASTDLAAGKTASFPRLTKQRIETELPELRHDALSASQVVLDSLDPFQTGVLDANKLQEGQNAQSQNDPYHKKKRPWLKPLVVVLVICCVIGAGFWFVLIDPAHVMPGVIASIEEAADELYPSREGMGSATTTDAATTAEAEAKRAKEESSNTILTEGQAYQRLLAIYKTIVEQHDGLENIIDDFNGGFVASDLETRKSHSSSAYASRTVLDNLIEELQSLNLEDDSAYSDDVQNLIQLASWVRTRVDRYCTCWDVSLSYTGDDLPKDHTDEILATYRETVEEDAEAMESYFANVVAFEPQPLS